MNLKQHTGWPMSTLAALVTLGLAGTAHATNGYFPHGYGIVAKGMGGAAVAMSVDSLGGANNPASMVWAGSRKDLGVDVFSPTRDASRSGASFPTLNGSVNSGRPTFYVPELGYNRLVGTQDSLGVTVYGNGGMDTAYPQGHFNCGAGPANLLCGSGPLGVDLRQLIVAPTWAHKLDAQHALGVSLLLGHQQFEATGLQAFDNPGAPIPDFTRNPGHVTNNGRASSHGIGLRVGYQGHVSERLTLGAAYAPRMHMSRFKGYEGLFADGGQFDIPAHDTLGLAWNHAF
ncbi:MAG: OmpP1/FadL family transporter [Leptothrix sp. (in: b-proteobacteria)]